MLKDNELKGAFWLTASTSILIAAFNEDQSERHTMLRRCKLKKEVVRKVSNIRTQRLRVHQLSLFKITNQTVSQSVPPPVITTINGYT